MGHPMMYDKFAIHMFARQLRLLLRLSYLGNDMNSPRSYR